VAGKTEAEHRQEMDTLQGALGLQIEGCQQKISEVSYENQYLRTIIAEQEEQIQRLSNALVGNKSHFAKFVEVKTENLSLQAKLDAFARAGNRYQNALLPGSNNLPAVTAYSEQGGTAAAHLLPAYQKMKTKLVATNNNMKILESGSGRASSDSGTSVPGLPLNTSLSDRWASASPRGGATSGAAVGNKLSSSGSASPSPRPVVISKTKGPNLIVGLGQQPHPPGGGDFGGIASTGGNSQGERGRKTMRIDHSASRLEEDGGESLQPLIPGVPLLGRHTREALKDRMVV
jgi:hypothetical protein